MTNMEPQERMKRLIAMSLAKLKMEKSIPIKLYFRSGREILRMANIYVEEGDEERAFQLYFRFVTLFVEKIVEHPEFKTADVGEKAFFKSQCKEVIPKLEKIKGNLLKSFERDYEKYQETERERLRIQRERQERQKRQEETSNKLLPLHIDANQEEDESRLSRAKEKLSKMVIQEQQTTTNFGPTALPSAPSPPDSPDRSVSPTRIHAAAGPSSLSPFMINTAIIPNNAIPTVDRSKKPAPVTPVTVSSSRDGLRTVILPSSLCDDFLRAASVNTARNVETCGILAGKLSHNSFTITHVVIPKQKGTSDSCLTSSEEEVFEFQDANNLTTLGWIHTHPTQSAFLSSIDLHTHFSYQIMLAEAVAIVCAPKFEDTGIFSLTPDYGIDFIGGCNKTGFHPHPNESMLYKTSAHVQKDYQQRARLVDLR